MVERGDTAGARRLAGVIASLLVLVTAAASLLGILLAPVVTDFAAPGFSGRPRVSGTCMPTVSASARIASGYARPEYSMRKPMALPWAPQPKQ